ncbi:MAG: AtpZ/AtpI family protein [Planctomycetaceae bacterium]|nr:AtpZ/AtpI family protein [Planctomycetaceae bacterium]
MCDDASSKRHRRLSSVAQAYRDSHEVMSAALSVAFLAGGGYWLDLKLGCQPGFTVIGLVVGCVAAAAALRQLLIRLDQRSQKSQPPSSSSVTPLSPHGSSKGASGDEFEGADEVTSPESGPDESGGFRSS